jgi:OOP family OmpA-OmpF porin
MNILDNKKALALITVIGLGSASFSPVQAGELDSEFTKEEIKAMEYWSSPWYAGMNVGASKLEPKVTVVGGSVTESASQGGKIYAGYKFNETLAFEAFYADLGAAEIDIVTDTSDVDYTAYGAGLILSVPVSGTLRLQGKIGYGKLENAVKAGLAYRQIEENMIYSGVGLEYRLNDHVSWRVDYDHYDKDYQFLSMGFQFHF